MNKNFILACSLVAMASAAARALSEGPSAPLLVQPISITEAAADQPGAAPPQTPPPPVASPSPSNAASAVQQPPVAIDATASAADPGPQPWHLPQPGFMQNLGINMGGWIQQGITFNSREQADGFNGPVVTNDLDRQYQLNQLWMYFVRPTKTDGRGFDIGGRIDVVYGTDWRFGQCVGLENRINDPNSYYGLILPQFYLEVAVNDLTVKMGHFATLTSYEAVPAPLNFFYSHTYLMAGYFDPLLVTGVQADYKLNDNWTVIGGANRGWEMFEDPSDSWNFLGGVKWVGDSKRATLAVMIDAGPQIGFTGLHDRNSCYTVFTYQFSDRLQYAAQYTVGIEQDGSIINPGENADWYGTEQMFIYKLNAKWSAGVRYEWVRDEDGARIAGVGNLLQSNKGWAGGPGFTGSFHDFSLGLNWRPRPNVVFRPEVRWDYYDGPPTPAALGSQLPFNNLTSRSQFTTAMDLVITY